MQWGYTTLSVVDRDINIKYIKAMKKITILVPQGVVPSSVSEPRYLFQVVNQFHKHAGLPEPFLIQLAGVQKAISCGDGAFTINCDVLISEVNSTDLLIIPALGSDIQNSLAVNEPLIGFVKEQYKNGAEIASLCVGAFLLASTGLLNGKPCSTHWAFANLFRSMFPEVKLADDRVVTEFNGLYSSGGATMLWNLLLYLVEKYSSREMAIRAAKYFLLDIERHSQSPFIIFTGMKEHGDEAIVQIQEFIENSFQSRITVDELSEKFGIGRRTLERRFKAATGNSITEYMQRVKVESAKKLLEKGRKTVSEIMWETGYSDMKAFRDVFKKVTGVSPLDYRGKFTRSEIAHSSHSFRL